MTHQTGLILGLIINALVGWGAGVIMHRGGGVIRNIIVGVLGGMLGTWLFGKFGFTAVDLKQEILVSLGGAIVLLFLLNVFFGRKK